MIGQDKKLHFAISTFLSIVCIGIAEILNVSVWWGFLLVVLILAGKEIVYDKLLKKGTPELMDFVYGLVPAIIILLICII
jgi:hypothetical protein